jgi:hypothetical protein
MVAESSDGIFAANLSSLQKQFEFYFSEKPICHAFQAFVHASIFFVKTRR